MLPFSRTNPRKQGDVGLGQAVGWFAANGYTVALPLTDSQDYDLIVDNGEQLLRVQVRTTRVRRPTGIYEVGLRVKGGNLSGAGRVKHFDPGRVELLYVLTESGDQYVIPTGTITNRSSVNLGVKYRMYQVE